MYRMVLRIISVVLLLVIAVFAGVGQPFTQPQLFAGLAVALACAVGANLP